MCQVEIYDPRPRVSIKYRLDPNLTLFRDESDVGLGCTPAHQQRATSASVDHSSGLNSEVRDHAPDPAGGRGFAARGRGRIHVASRFTGQWRGRVLRELTTQRVADRANRNKIIASANGCADHPRPPPRRHPANMSRHPPAGELGSVSGNRSIPDTYSVRDNGTYGSCLRLRHSDDFNGDGRPPVPVGPGRLNSVRTKPYLRCDGTTVLRRPCGRDVVTDSARERGVIA